MDYGYCANQDCRNGGGYGTVCKECGRELTPEIRCLCGERGFNPKRFPWQPAGERAYLLPRFCEACGAELTEAYLGRCMAAQLKEMVKEIAAKQSAELTGFLD